MITASLIFVTSQTAPLPQSIEESFRSSSTVVLGKIVGQHEPNSAGLASTRIEVLIPYRDAARKKTIDAIVPVGQGLGSTSLFFLYRTPAGELSERLPYIRLEPSNWLRPESGPFYKRFIASLHISAGKIESGLRIRLVKYPSTTANSFWIYLQNTTSETLKFEPNACQLSVSVGGSRGKISSTNISLAPRQFQIEPHQIALVSSAPFVVQSKGQLPARVEVTLGSNRRKPGDWSGRVRASLEFLP